MADKDSLQDFFAEAIDDLEAGASQSDLPTILAARPVAKAEMGMLPGHEVTGFIARGGMGAVYLARQQALEREVAVKVMTAEADSPEMAARFRREALVLGRLAHPNIVPVYDIGTDDEGQLFYTMKLVKGRTLQHILNDLRAEDAAALREHTLASLLTVFRKVCDALAFAHSQGIIHRDLKPENVMVGEFGEVLVMDWGLAKTLRQGDLEMGRQGEDEVSLSDRPMVSLSSKTLQGSVMGTPQYMSPEQAMGLVDELDARSDIFSLGGILYAILTLRPPVEGATLEEVLSKVRTGSITPPSSFGTASDGKTKAKGAVLEARKVRPLPHSAGGRVPAALSAVVMKALRVEKAERYQDVAELSADIEKFQGGFATNAEQAGVMKQLALLIQRNKGIFTTAAVAWLLLTALAVWFVFNLRAKEQRAVAGEQKATAAFDELRATAPAFAEQARGLAAKEQYADAIAKLDYAIKLRPDAAEFLVAKGDLLQCQLKLAPASALYREALRVQPGLARAGASAKLCEELLAASPAADGKLSRESLAKLHVAMQQQQRPAAELLLVARLLGEEKKLVLNYWLARLKNLPISAENPLAQRLTVREDGRLALDLSGTKVTDLSPLLDAPLAVLNLGGSTELTDLSPLADLALIELQLDSTGVTDLTPLRDMHSLKTLTVNKTQVADLAPLSALRLKRLSLVRSRVTDLTPLQKMPIEDLNLLDTRVTELSPLSGMPIKILDLSSTPVRDFSPLAQMPLEKCYLTNTRITDLTVLRGRPLKELSLNGCPQVRHYTVLAEIPTLETLLLPATFRLLPHESLAAIGALRTHPKLRQIQADFEGPIDYSATQSKDLFWQDWDLFQTFLPALRKSGFRFNLTKQPDGTYHFGIVSQPLSDLSFLKGAPISSLVVHNCKITDLTPLRDLPLRYLNLDNNHSITDLSALRGIPLETLRLRSTAVSDLSPLAGMPLKELHLQNCQKLTDISPLLEVPTLELLLLPTGARNLDLLRKMPNLKTLDFNYIDRLDTAGLSIYTVGSTVEDFWKKWDALGWMRALNDTGIPYTASEIKEKTSEGDNGTGMWSVRIASKDFSDCSIFKSAANIQEMNLSDSAVTDLAPLADWKGLQSLILPPDVKDIEFLRTCTQLKRISFKENPMTRQPAQTAAEFWKDYDSQVWLRALLTSGLAIKSIKQLEDGTWDVDLEGSKISDLAILKGAPISRLILNKTAVSDLTALRECPLRRLGINTTAVTDLAPLRGLALVMLAANGTAVADLEPLRGMALKELAMHGTKVTDLRPLQGMPLETLNLKMTKVTDLSALRGMPLTKLEFLNCPDLTDLSPLAETKGLSLLILPPNAKEIDFLRTFPKLERVGFNEHPVSRNLPDKTAAEFWEEWDAKKKSENR